MGKNLISLDAIFTNKCVKKEKSHNIYTLTWLGKGSRQKKRIFYGQADRKGGGGGSTSPGLTVAFVKKLTLFSYGI